MRHAPITHHTNNFNPLYSSMEPSFPCPKVMIMTIVSLPYMLNQQIRAIVKRGILIKAIMIRKSARGKNKINREIIMIIVFIRRQRWMPVPAARHGLGRTTAQYQLPQRQRLPRQPKLTQATTMTTTANSMIFFIPYEANETGTHSPSVYSLLDEAHHRFVL
jgi:hypothetical protein